MKRDVEIVLRVHLEDIHMFVHEDKHGMPVARGQQDIDPNVTSVEQAFFDRLASLFGDHLTRRQIKQVAATLMNEFFDDLHLQ